MFAATARLDGAYRATAYRVRRVGRDVVLRIGRAPPPLPWGASRQACVVTACNPVSRPCPVAFNRLMARRLDQTLRRRGLRALPCVARADAGDWPPEPGMLVFAITRRSAAALGRVMRQNAILHLGRRTVALVPLA